MTSLNNGPPIIVRTSSQIEAYFLIDKTFLRAVGFNLASRNFVDGGAQAHTLWCCFGLGQTVGPGQIAAELFKTLDKLPNIRFRSFSCTS